MRRVSIERILAALAVGAVTLMASASVSIAVAQEEVQRPNHVRIACTQHDKVGEVAAVVIVEQTSREFVDEKRQTRLLDGSDFIDPSKSGITSPEVVASLKRFEGLSLGDNPTHESVQEILDNESYTPDIDVEGVMIRTSTKYFFGNGKTIFLDLDTNNTELLDHGRYINKEITSERHRASCMMPYAVGISSQ